MNESEGPDRSHLETRGDWKAQQLYERWDTMWRECQEMNTFAREEIRRVQKVKEAERRAEIAAHPKSSPSRRGSAQGRKPEENDGLASDISEKAEKQFVTCCKPFPCDIKLLQILGQEGEQLLTDDYERVYEYFRNKNMTLDRQFVGVKSKEQETFPEVAGHAGALRKREDFGQASAAGSPQSGVGGPLVGGLPSPAAGSCSLPVIAPRRGSTNASAKPAAAKAAGGSGALPPVS